MSSPFLPFTFAHGLAASLLLHGALILPFVVVLEEAPREDDPLLVVELQGLISDTQSEQQVLQQTKGAPEQKPQEETPQTPATQTAQAPEPDQPQEDTAADGTLAPAPPPTPEQQETHEDAPPQTSAQPEAAQAGAAGAADVAGAQEQKQAQTVAPVDETQLLKAYVRSLTKKLKDNLAYPADARQKIHAKGTTYVSFVVEPDGSLADGSLKVTRSSGNPAYDAAALRTVEKNAPFEAPPRRMAVGVPVDYFPN